MKNRRFKNSSIDQLEKSFASSRDDLVLLQDLSGELQFRTTRRAQSLRAQVDAQMALLKNVGNAVQPTTINVTVLPGSDSVLAAWLTLEVLSPQPLPDARDLEALGRTLVRFDDHPEPWQEQRFWRHGKERAVFWLVYLGELDLAKATASILRIYPDETIDEKAEIRGNTTLAVIVLDSYGRPVEDSTFLSSFAWGYGKVRAEQIRALAGFPDAEASITTALEKRLLRQDEDGKILPLTHAEIQQAIDWLAGELNLPNEEVIRPGFAVRVPQWGNFIEAPEPELLNSFYIGDLVNARAAVASNQVGQGLAAYLGSALLNKRRDVVRDRSLLDRTLAPARTPLARWPSPKIIHSF